MEILVCVKQVPDTAEVKIDPVKHTVIRAGVPNIFNPFDQNALEAALQLKDADKEVKVTLVAMGPDQAKDVLREGLAMGADDAYLVSDRKLGGSDTLATGYALAQAIKKIAADKGIAQFDLILCGKQAIDGDTAQVGPQIACELGIPQITYAAELKVDGTTVTVKQQNEEGYIITEAQFPVLVTAVKELNEPRFPTIRGTMKAKRREIPTLDAAAIGADDAQIGLSGSPTKVRKIFTPPQRTQGLVLKVEDDNSQEIVDQLVEKLTAAKIV
ncbi:electron transfer flavoprotein subunit beta/FixA family protein [uncultured Megasphaera sp.]|uniref:electron transfer flavoprotein subunit beta/FixA family protein n=1 Tax=uncultured Megasphaera sp. TaxID=165188 RepID=UPI00265B6B46|nr:electron transfer flavoprotein subunit beta/FixA family protein [uncultured Megasphaera sp.]